MSADPAVMFDNRTGPEQNVLPNYRIGINNRVCASNKTCTYACAPRNAGGRVNEAFHYKSFILTCFKISSAHIHMVVSYAYDGRINIVVGGNTVNLIERPQHRKPTKKCSM